MSINGFDSAVAAKSVGKVYAPTRYINLSNKRDYVVVVHGLGFSKFCVSKTIKALKKKGYVVMYFEYPTRKYPIDVLANEFLAKYIKYNCTDKKKKINFVTHSFGGILVRKYLADNPSIRVGRVVMIAPPNHGSPIIDFFKNNLLFKFLFGPAAQQLGTSKNSYINLFKSRVNYDLGIIAGNRCINPISFFLIREAHDGIVTVNSTKLKGMKEHIIVNSPHLFMLNNELVINQVLNFLEIGCFKK